MSLLVANGMSIDCERLNDELEASRARCIALEGENVELRSSLRKSISGSMLGREFEALSVEREKMVRLIDQLKIEKTHLVESVLMLSGEVDDANRLRQDDQLKFKQEVLRHAENERTMRAGKYRMGIQVVELLRIRGIDKSIRQEVNNYIANSCVASGGVASFESMMGISGRKCTNLEEDAANIINSPHYPRSTSSDDNDTAGHFWEETTSPTNNSDIHSVSRSGRGNRPRKRRHYRPKRSEVLGRDETDSIISSVSTHRSGLSAAATPKTNGNRYHSGSRRSHTPITAEALAMLDKLNNSGGSGRTLLNKQDYQETRNPVPDNWWGW